MDRQILHVDCNKFYASVECCLHPELRDKPIAVGGSEESRHGIILTKNEIAARYGLVTGEPLWAARQKCPELIVVPPHFSTYIRFYGMVRKILAEYTDRIEPFGLDEAWLELTGGRQTPEAVAQEIRRRVREELGITVSIGVSFTKPFAKLGSDYKKPDATTVITRENYRDILYPLPIGDMMYVGKSSAAVLRRAGILTLGDIYAAGQERLTAMLGKGGENLWRNVAGLDDSPVMPIGYRETAKSVGNSITFRRDLVSESDFNAGLTMLCESVCQRLRAAGLFGTCVTVQIKDPELRVISRQTHISAPTNATSDVLAAARELVKRNWQPGAPARMLSVSVSDLSDNPGVHQMSFFNDDEQAREKDRRLYSAVDGIRAKFGGSALRMGNLLSTDIVSDGGASDEDGQS